MDTSVLTWVMLDNILQFTSNHLRQVELRTILELWENNKIRDFGSLAFSQNTWLSLYHLRKYSLHCPRKDNYPSSTSFLWRIPTLSPENYCSFSLQALYNCILFIFVTVWLFFSHLYSHTKSILIVYLVVFMGLAVLRSCMREEL